VRNPGAESPLPINTRINFTKANKENVFVKLPNGAELRIANISKFTGDDIARAGLWLEKLYLAFGMDSKPASLRQAAYGEIYYMQLSLFHGRHVHGTANYRRTFLVLINAPVTYVCFNVVQKPFRPFCICSMR
jgi:hypothetical protein